MRICEESKMIGLKGEIVWDRLLWCMETATLRFVVVCAYHVIRLSKLKLPQGGINQEQLTDFTSKNSFLSACKFLADFCLINTMLKTITP